MGMILIPVSCTMSWTSVYSSSGTLSIRSSPLNLFLTSKYSPQIVFFAPYPLGVVGGNLARLFRQKQAIFRLQLKKVRKSTRPLSYDLNQIPCDYTVEMKNRFKGLGLVAWRTMDGGLCGNFLPRTWKWQTWTNNTWTVSARTDNFIPAVKPFYRSREQRA